MSGAPSFGILNGKLNVKYPPFVNEESVAKRLAPGKMANKCTYDCFHLDLGQLGFHFFLFAPPTFAGPCP
jgi:hypothetical protein